MKAVQINFTEAILEQLDADAKVRRLGRSEVIRRLAVAYLRERRERQIEQAYARGYGPDFPPAQEEMEGLGEKLLWPDE